MLVREPEKRASLAEIATDPWVTAGEGVTVEDFDTPLVAKEQLTEDDRSAIVQRMVNGNIATKEQILDSLEKNEYNHITATYYLLAERKLRAKRCVQLFVFGNRATKCSFQKNFNNTHYFVQARGPRDSAQTRGPDRLSRWWRRST